VPARHLTFDCFHDLEDQERTSAFATGRSHRTDRPGGSPLQVIGGCARRSVRCRGLNSNHGGRSDHGVPDLRQFRSSWVVLEVAQRLLGGELKNLNLGEFAVESSNASHDISVVVGEQAEHTILVLGKQNFATGNRREQHADADGHAENLAAEDALRYPVSVSVSAKPTVALATIRSVIASRPPAREANRGSLPAQRCR